MDLCNTETVLLGMKPSRDENARPARVEFRTIPDSNTETGCCVAGEHHRFSRCCFAFRCELLPKQDVTYIHVLAYTHLH